MTFIYILFGMLSIVSVEMASHDQSIWMTNLIAWPIAVFPVVAENIVKYWRTIG